jgi:hypothetical protein
MEIKKHLSEIEDKVWFLKWLLAKIEQKQNINTQNTNTESKETNPNLLNKELKDYTPEEAKEWLKYLQDHYQNYKRPWIVDWKINENAKINEIEDNHDAHLFQKELIKKIDPELFKTWFTDTHIRWFDFIKWESIISIEDFKEKLNNPNTKIKWDKFDENVISYMEISRYIRYIEKKEWKELDFSDNNDEKNYKTLEKYLPKHILENFITDWKGQMKANNIFSTWKTSDEIKQWEYDIILENLTNEKEELILLYVKEWYTVKEIEQIIINEDNTKKQKLEKYRNIHKEYYDAEKKQIEEEENETLKNKTTVTKSLNSDSWTNIYTQTNNWYLITDPNWEEIKISEKEKNNTFWRPNALKNLINFHNFFKELNLLWVWEYREELMLAVGDININPNDNDSIKTEELRKFWNKLLTFISNVENKWKWKKIELNSINSVNSELRKFSWSNSMLSDSKTFNTQWEDKFTSYLRSQWIIWGAYFKINEFRKILW